MTVLDTARLRAARERAGLNQTEVSTRLNMAKGVCGEWERGVKLPSLEKFAALCRLLDVSADQLLGLDTPPAATGAPARGTAAARHPGVDSPDAVLSDERFPEGLRALADSRSHQAALRITPAEWATLASLDLAGGLTREGYVGLLVLLRATAARVPAAPHDPHVQRRPGERPAPLGTGHGDAGKRHAVHEPDSGDYEPDPDDRPPE